MTDALQVPRAGVRHRDARGRTLVVQEVALGDHLGREVRGQIAYDVPEGHAPNADLWREQRHASYACDLATWQAVWRDKAPAWAGRL